MTRRRRAEEGGGDSWLTTYSDMVTLLLAFFVMMFSFSSIDAEKFERLLNSVQSALGMEFRTELGGAPLPAPEEVESMVVDAEALLRERDFRQLEEVRSMLESGLLARLPDTRYELRMEERGLILRLEDRILFDSGKAQLKPEARAILSIVGQELAAFPNHIRIEGHTDDRPINTPRFPSNWELSTARATEVIRFLLDNTDLVPIRLSAAGYGEHRPAASNDTPEGRARNRRVDVVVLRLSFSGGEPK